MKVTLDNKEILTALVNYIDNMGINTVGKKVSVDITNGRKTGLSADVEITEEVHESESEEDNTSIFGE